MAPWLGPSRRSLAQAAGSNVLADLIDRMFPGVLTGPPNDDLKSQAVSWAETCLRATPVESSAYREAVVQLLIAKLQGDEPRARLAGTYLRGEPVPAPELKTIGVYEKLDKAVGFRFLRSMCQLLQRSGLAKGTVLLFDEARRSLSLMSNKAQKEACENLLSVINHLNSGDLPGTLFLYGVMPPFFTDFAPRYAALQQRCGPATRINLETIKGINEIDLLFQIGQRITSVYECADGTPKGDRGVLDVKSGGSPRWRFEDDGRRDPPRAGQGLVPVPS